MNSFMKSASRLTLIAALAASPAALYAQTANTDSDAAKTEELSGTEATNKVGSEVPKMTAEGDASAEATTDSSTSGDTMAQGDAAATTDSDASKDTMAQGDAAATTDSNASGDTMAQGDAAATDDTKSDDTMAQGDAAATSNDTTSSDTNMAQDSTAPDATTSNDTMAQGTADPAASTTATEPAATENTDMAAGEEQAKPVEGQITMQGENTVLAKNLLGSNVYSTADESIGEINDLIVNLDGKVDGVVIGVGGFLGLGEKDVAVEMSSLSVTTADNGDTRLVTSATRDDLEAAPEFVTKEQQDSAQRSMENSSAMDNSNAAGSDATAPKN
ncbi:PRC-barrel domain-containing protein [Oceaniglobus roseus]|uniref:PRC-barrel domain-containing protein n=1 Tax=Oceaniglobus roseus TaxID=1737570 RepID=UPI000C7E9F86|nr:PRC-barrel domain-containing protein [Kandeliimicrobium roseum]